MAVLLTCDAVQKIWEGVGVNWEWTWYSQTVHAFTEPQGVGSAATAVRAVPCSAVL